RSTTQATRKVERAGLAHSLGRVARVGHRERSRLATPAEEDAWNLRDAEAVVDHAEPEIPVLCPRRTDVPAARKQRGTPNRHGRGEEPRSRGIDGRQGTGFRRELGVCCAAMKILRNSRSIAVLAILAGVSLTAPAAAQQPEGKPAAPKAPATTSSTTAAAKP